MPICLVAFAKRYENTSAQNTVESMFRQNCRNCVSKSETTERDTRYKWMRLAFADAKLLMMSSKFILSVTLCSVESIAKFDSLS